MVIGLWDRLDRNKQSLGNHPMTPTAVNEFSVRRPFGTFIFSALFLAHLFLVLSMLQAFPDFNYASVSGDLHVLSIVGVYALSFALSLISGLCILSSIYVRHYSTIGILVSIPNAVGFFLLKDGLRAELVLLLIGNQAMASVLMVGGLLLRFLMPFKLVKVKQCAISNPVVVNIPTTHEAPPSTPGRATPKQPSTPQRSPAHHFGRPIYFPDAQSEHGTCTPVQLPPNYF